MSEFRIPPVSTLIGADPVHLSRVISSGDGVEGTFRKKLFLSYLISSLTWPFHLVDRFTWDKRAANESFSEPPVFILGHWRSGTTFLHNLLCSDPQAAYVTTFQSLFPNEMASQWLFKPLMKRTMPDRRPSDNVVLGPDLPQEDEFALGNLSVRSFYHFFYFPHQYLQYRKMAVDEVNSGEDADWDRIYRLMLVKALMNSSGRRLIIKNPVNTARIPALLRLFPDARFIYIRRNPVTTCLSTLKFFGSVFPALWFHKASPDFIEQMIPDNLVYFTSHYQDHRHLIPESNLIEISYEELLRDPVLFLKVIYSRLLKDDYTRAQPVLENYLSSQQSHERNKYVVSKAFFDRLITAVEPLMKSGSYAPPENIEIR